MWAILVIIIGLIIYFRFRKYFIQYVGGVAILLFIYFGYFSEGYVAGITVPKRRSIITEEREREDGRDRYNKDNLS